MEEGDLTEEDEDDKDDIRFVTLECRFESKETMCSLLQAVLSCRNPPRLREVWMNPHSCHSFAWFDKVEASFPYDLIEL